MKRGRLLVPIADMWRPLLLYVCGAALLVTLLGYRLGSLTPAFAQAELATKHAAISGKFIADNPLYIFHKSNLLVLQKLSPSSTAAIRLPSLVIAVVSIVAFFVILSKWYSHKVAVLGTVLFASSSWLLHGARLATFDINYVMPLLLVFLLSSLFKARYAKLVTIAALLTGLFIAYIPGMIWGLALLAFWQRRQLKKITWRVPLWWHSLLLVGVLVGLLPLFWSFFNNPRLIMSWTGLPEHWPSVTSYVKNLVNIPTELFIASSGNPLYNIGRVPLLDAFTAALVVLGGFAYWHYKTLDRSKFMLAATITGILLIALNGPVRLSWLIPIIYLLAAEGIAFLLQQWFTVFPRNPVARWIGFVVLGLAVSITAFYHIQNYFVAWPNTPETRQAFSHQP